MSVGDNVNTHVHLLSMVVDNKLPRIILTKHTKHKNYRQLHVIHNDVMSLQQVSYLIKNFNIHGSDSSWQLARCTIYRHWYHRYIKALQYCQNTCSVFFMSWYLSILNIDINYCICFINTIFGLLVWILWKIFGWELKKKDKKLYSTENLHPQ